MNIIFIETSSRYDEKIPLKTLRNLLQELFQIFEKLLHQISINPILEVECHRQFVADLVCRHVFVADIQACSSVASQQTL